MAKNTTKSSKSKITDTPNIKVSDVKTRRVAKDTSQINPEYTDAFINEVNEDVKNDNFKVLWNRYGIFVILFVVLAVMATVSFEKIKSWKTLCSIGYS